MATERDRLMAVVERYIRYSSGYMNLHKDMGKGHSELMEDIDDMEPYMVDAEKDLEEVLFEQDEATLIWLILALTGNFGDTSTKEGEKRLEELKGFFLEK